jgi:hypothetical protein
MGLKLIANLLGLLICFGVGLLVMILGWGLTPHSWGWIIGGGLGGIFLGAILAAVAQIK